MVTRSPFPNFQTHPLTPRGSQRSPQDQISPNLTANRYFQISTHFTVNFQIFGRCAAKNTLFPNISSFRGSISKFPDPPPHPPGGPITSYPTIFGNNLPMGDRPIARERTLQSFAGSPCVDQGFFSLKISILGDF